MTSATHPWRVDIRLLHVTADASKGVWDLGIATNLHNISKGTAPRVSFVRVVASTSLNMPCSEANRDAAMSTNKAVINECDSPGPRPPYAQQSCGRPAHPSGWSCRHLQAVHGTSNVVHHPISLQAGSCDLVLCSTIHVRHHTPPPSRTGRNRPVPTSWCQVNTAAHLNRHHQCSLSPDNLHPPGSPDTPMSAVSTPGLKLPLMLCSSCSSPWPCNTQQHHSRHQHTALLLLHPAASACFGTICVIRVPLEHHTCAKPTQQHANNLQHP
jgi:hypothetical protein